MKSTYKKTIENNKNKKNNRKEVNELKIDKRYENLFFNSLQNIL